jgi:hypothetical protein
LAGDATRYEIVFGHRRHRACLELGLPVLAVLATAPMPWRRMPSRGRGGRRTARVGCRLEWC